MTAVRWSILLFVSVFMVCAGCRDVPQDAVAVYNGGEVTRAEMIDYMQSGLRPTLRDNGTATEEEGIAELIDRYAAMEILASEAEPVGESRDESWLYLDERARVLVRFYVEVVGKRTFEISDEEVRSTYDERLESLFTLPEKAMFQHVFLRRDHHEPDEARRIFETIRERLGDGSSWEEMVAEYSESGTVAQQGVVGPVFRGKMDPEFEEELFAHTTPDEVFEIEAANGFHLVRLMRFFPARVMTFEEARPQIVSMLMDERAAEIREELLADLREAHDVEVVDDWRKLGQDDAAIRIGDRSMTRSAVERFLGMRSRPSLTNDIFEAGYETSLINDLVESNLMYLDAVDRGLDNDPVFESRWRHRVLRRSADRARAERFLRWTEGVSTEEVHEAFETNPRRYWAPPRFDLRFVYVPFGDDEPFARLNVAEELGELLADRERFEELQNRSAEVGARAVDLGVVSGRQTLGLGPDVQRTLVAMEPHRVSGPIRVSGGVVVLGLGDAWPRRELVFPEDEDEIRTRFLQHEREGFLRGVDAAVLEEYSYELLTSDLFPEKAVPDQEGPDR